MKIQRRNNKNNRRHLSIKSLALMALFLFSVVAPIAGTWGAKARAVEGDGQASTYGIKVSNGKVDFKASDIKSAVWINANKVVVTFANNKTATFYPEKDGDKSPLEAQRLESRNGNGIVTYKSMDIGCDAKISWDLDQGNFFQNTARNVFIMKELQKGTIDIWFEAGTASECTAGDKPPTINFTNPKLSVAYFKWIDSAQIDMADDDPKGSFTRVTGTNYFFRDIEGAGTACRDKLLVDVAKNEATYWELAKEFTLDEDAPDIAKTGTDCKYNKSGWLPSNLAIPIAGKENSIKTALSGTSNTNKAADKLPPALTTCEVDGNPLTWIICPVINGARKLIEALNGTINSLLTLPTDKLFVTSNNYSNDTVANQFYGSWSGFRYIAMGLLVIIALIMVLSQAIGVGPFDAYTIRKVLPRLLAAVVLVSLSWPLMKLAVEITNGIGHSVSGLIYGPFSSNLAKDNPSDLVMGSAIIGGVTGAFTLGIFGLLAFVATAALSLLSGMATLIFREMLIMFLVVVAPVAIICSILPNTQTVWKKWSDYFLRALIVFPIFSGVIAIGQVFAVIGTQLYDDTLGSIISFVGYFGPYFMLPKIFAMSGGAVAAVGSVAQKATAGMRGGLSNYRNKKAGKRYTNAGVRSKDGKFLPGRFDRFGGNAINRRVSGVAGGAKAGFGFGERGRTYETGNSNRVAAEAKKAPGFEHNKYEAGALRALTDHRNEREARAAGVSDADIQTAKTMGGWSVGTRQAALEQRFANKDGFANASEAMATINAMSGGNARRRTGLMANGSFINKSVGRSDMGKLSLQGGDNGEFAGETAAEYQDRMTLEGAATADSATLARNHSIGASNIADAANRQLVTPANSALHEAAGLVATKMTEAQGYATLGNIGTIQDVSDVVSNTPAALTEVVGRHINPATGEVVVDRTGVTQPTAEDITRDTRQQELDVAGENLRRATAEVAAARAAAAAVGPAVAGSPPPPELEAAANAEQRLQQRQQEHTAAAATNIAAAAAAVAADTPGATRRTPSVFAKNRSPNPNNPNDPNNPT